MRIDSHVYLSEAHPPEHLLAILHRNRFDGAILVVDGPRLPAVPPPIVGLIVRDDGLDSRTLQEYRKQPAFRAISCALARGIPQAVDELVERGIPLDVEMHSGDFPALLELAERLPGLRLVIDHLARPDFGQGINGEWARGMESAAKCPQVFCKISGLLTEQRLPWSAAPIRPFVQHALAVFGPSRLMFGSEWPARLPEIIWKETLAAFTQSIGAQPVEVRERLLGGTAREVYGIQDESSQPSAIS